jgi:metal-responsive CopG/Arc/MetJ family transcriptional regulator
MKEETKDQNARKTVAVRLPKEIATAMDAAIREQDTDRSKFVRGAIRARLQALKPTTR